MMSKSVLPRLAAAVALAVALLLAAASPASAAAFNPIKYKYNSAAPVTAKVASMRSAAGAVVLDWKKQNVATSYSAYLTALRKPVSMATNKAKQATFAANLAAIAARNNNTKIGWAAAPGPFTDMNVTERARVLLKKGPPGVKRTNAVAALAATRMTPAQILAQAPPAVAQDAPAMAAAAVAYLAPETAAALSAAAVTAQGLLDGVPDWSSVLPSIKNQGQCGSCWAFATTSLMEAGHYIKTGEVLPLSEKQLVDCDTNDGGCDGGFYDTAFDYLIKAGGQASEAAYPYVAVQGTCPSQLPPRVSKLASYKALPQNNEAAMLAALMDGPIGVGITVDDSLYDYAGGVYSSTACGGPPNHAVVVVGAGVDDDTKMPYWLIRNTWGDSWGEGGYFRLQRGVGGSGMCNVAKTPFSIVSGDSPATPAPPAPPAGCKPVTAVTDNTTKTWIWNLAVANNASVAQVLIDNGLDHVFDLPFGGKFYPWAGATPPSVPVGTTIKINTCQPGTWSKPYGAWNSGQDWNGLRAAPYVGFCPPGAYVAQIYARPSWISSNSNAGGWIGRITMTCNDGTTLTADAMPGNINTYWPDGSQTQMNGFTTISFKSGMAIDSLLGIGDISGEPGNFTCPTGTILTGFSATTGVNEYWTGSGIIDSLQFFCSNPFGSNTTGQRSVSALHRSPYPKLKARLSCKSYTAETGDTLFSIASKFSTASLPITYTDIIRANPMIASSYVTAGTLVYIPPCINGVPEPRTKPSTPGVSSAAAPAEAAAAASVAWDSSTPEGRAAYRAAFDAQPYIQEMAQKAKAAATAAAAAQAPAAAAPQP